MSWTCSWGPFLWCSWVRRITVAGRGLRAGLAEVLHGRSTHADTSNSEQPLCLIRQKQSEGHHADLFPFTKTHNVLNMMKCWMYGPCALLNLPAQPLQTPTWVSWFPHLDVDPWGVGFRGAVCSETSDDLWHAAVGVPLHEQDETSQWHKHAGRDSDGLEKSSPSAPPFWREHSHRTYIRGKLWRWGWMVFR